VTQRLPRVERREQILGAATHVFARSGYTDTNLDDVAAEAGITRVLLYRHFESKSDMYRAVLDRARVRLSTAIGAGEYDGGTISALLRAAAADPDGFRLLFRFAFREPEFRDLMDSLRANARTVAYDHLAKIADDRWRDWASRVLPTITLEAVMTWLDAGQPDPDNAAARISAVVRAVTQAAADPYTDSAGTRDNTDRNASTNATDALS
jgi:AcrR family transcriptional regulator